MPDYEITCPYCFRTFSHTRVHFRMETCFDETELNDESYTQAELERMPASGRKALLLEQTNRRLPFRWRDDEKYTRFWSAYGKTTETASGADRKLPCAVWQLPVLDPSDPKNFHSLRRQRVETSGAADFFIYDRDGMVIGVEDCFGAETRRRVCPECHNPLPLGYGKHDVKFLSVIGVTGSGKTVYISQLLKYMGRYTTFAGMTSYFTSDHETDFIERNMVAMNKPLPGPTMEGSLSQPMFYDLVDRSHHTETIVIYDIAGENCQRSGDMLKYGKFVSRSSGIILLLDPSQLDLVAGTDQDPEVKAADTSLVLNTIYGAFVGGSSSEKCDIPVAVCISKSDTFLDSLPEQARTDITPALDPETDRELPCFNATEYNRLQPGIVKLMDRQIRNSMRTGYSTYNYFVFSATGCPVRKENVGGMERSIPVAPPVPKRIAEPLLWMFCKFGYIRPDVPIRLPEPRKAPAGVPLERTFMEKLLGKPPRMRELTPEELESYCYEEDC